MPILSDAEILKAFQANRNKFVEWRDNTGWLAELIDCYAAVEGDNDSAGQWLEGELDKRKTDKLPSYTINKLQPIVDGISGFEVQNRTTALYSPRTLELADKAQIDRVNDGLEYIEGDSGASYEESWCFRDMLTCGMGSTDDFITHDNKIDGDPEVERHPPYLIGFDTAARKKNLVNANWCFYGVLKDSDQYLDEVNAELEENDKDPIESLSCADGDGMLEHFDLKNSTTQTIAYVYQWRVKEPFYQVENPLFGRDDILRHPDPMQQQMIDQSLDALGVTFGFDPRADEVFTIEKGQYKDLKEAFEAFNVGCKHTKHSVWRYYRAKIVGDTVVSAGENYSQKTFSQKFMTGKYSESKQRFYGVVSAGKDPQRLLNKGVSDIAEFAYHTPVAGVIMDEDAVSDLQAFVDTYARARNITVVAPGALAAGKIKEKTTQAMPAGRFDIVQFATVALLESMGVTMEFMGQGAGGSNDYDMISRRVKQCIMTLAPYFDARTQYTIDKGKLRLDMLRQLSENSRGRIIRNISKTPNQQGQVMPYVKLLPDDIAAEYDIVVKETAKSPDEQKELLDKLIAIADMVARGGGDPRGMLPIIIEQTDIPADKTEQVLEATKPPAPPAPDPVNQELLISQSALNRATAAKYEAEAKEKNLKLLSDYQGLQDNLDTKQKVADIEKTQAEIKEILAGIGNSRAQTFHTLTQPRG